MNSEARSINARGPMQAALGSMRQRWDDRDRPVGACPQQFLEPYGIYAAGPHHLVAMNAVCHQQAVDTIICRAGQVRAQRIADGENPVLVNRPAADLLRKLPRRLVGGLMRLAGPVDVATHRFVDGGHRARARQQLATYVDDQIGVAAYERHAPQEGLGEERTVAFARFPPVIDNTGANDRRSAFESHGADVETCKDALIPLGSDVVDQPVAALGDMAACEVARSYRRVPRMPAYADPVEQPRERGGGSRRVRNEDDRPALRAEPGQRLPGVGVSFDPVVQYAP